MFSSPLMGTRPQFGCWGRCRRCRRRCQERKISPPGALVSLKPTIEIFLMWLPCVPIHPKNTKFLLFSLNKFADKVCTFWQWNVATEVCKLSKIPRMLFQKACCFRCMSVPAPKSFLTLVFEDVSTFSFLWQSTSISLICICLINFVTALGQLEPRLQREKLKRQKVAI